MTQDKPTPTTVPITTSVALLELCQKLEKEEFIAVDTEFMRERTYYPQLCLVQVAGAQDAATIDALIPDLDWTPFWELMRNGNVLKIFHAPRQDIEIFVNLAGVVPQPLFDSQTAAMACGFPDQVSYARLAEKLTGVVINKEEQFTDWTRRPLRPAQLEYALQDVTVLRDVYKALVAKLAASGRLSWLAEDMHNLNSIDFYRVDPDAVWQRLKLRTSKASSWNALKLLAAWREREAIRANRPRQMILKDDVLSQLALSLPDTPEKLALTRNVPGNIANGRHMQTILNLVTQAKASKDAAPARTEQVILTSAQEDQLELLKLALKIVARQQGIAPRLIADGSDIEGFVTGRDNDLKHGWRWEIFGSKATALLNGEIALKMQDNRLVLEA